MWCIFKEVKLVFIVNTYLHLNTVYIKHLKVVPQWYLSRRSTITLSTCFYTVGLVAKDLSTCSTLES